MLFVSVIFAVYAMNLYADPADESPVWDTTTVTSAAGGSFNPEGAQVMVSPDPVQVGQTSVESYLVDATDFASTF